MPNKTKKYTKKELNVFYYIAETGSLMFMPRTHQRSLINTFDTVASHAYHTAIIAYSLARLEGLSQQESSFAALMGLLHDNPEARTGDQDFPAKHYGTIDEEKAIKNQLKSLPFGDELLSLYHQYQNRETKAAKCAKDADSLEQLYQEWVLTNTGNKMAQRWLEGDYINRVPFLRTESAKKIAYVMKDHQPHDWWWKDMVDKNLNSEHLNGKK